MEHNNVFIATSFGRYDRHYANVIHNLKGWSHVVEKDGKDQLDRSCEK